MELLSILLLHAMIGVQICHCHIPPPIKMTFLRDSSVYCYGHSATIYLHVNLTQVRLFQHKVQQCGREDGTLLLNVAMLASGVLDSLS
jgi:hypothetical protein